MIVARNIAPADANCRLRLSAAGNDAGLPIATVGRFDLANSQTLGILCSARCPGELILRAHDWTRRARDSDLTVVSGFHSPTEQACLAQLLDGTCPVIVCPARSIESMRIPQVWRKPLEAGRMLVISPFAEKEVRMTATLARRRTELVGQLSDEILIIHAAPGSKTEAAARSFAAAGKKLLTFDSAANENLMAMGAVIIK